MRRARRTHPPGPFTRGAPPAPGGRRPRAAAAVLAALAACARTAPPAPLGTPPVSENSLPADSASPTADSPLALANLAASRAASGDLPGAEATLVRALGATPDSPLILAELARVRMAAGRSTEAIVPAVRAADLAGGSDGRIYLLATSARLRAGQALEAEAELARWERNFGSSPLLRVSRGLVREQQGQSRQAEEEYRAALRSDPSCAEALSGVVKLSFERGDAASALAAVRGSRAGGAAPRLWEAQALRRLDRIEEAEAALRAALSAEPDHPAALAELGALRASRGDYAEARALLARALELEPGLEAARANLAEVDRRLADRGSPPPRSR